MQDSILNEANSKQLNELEAKYETEKKENEIKLLTKEKELDKAVIERGKLVRNSLIWGTGLIFMLGVLVFSRYREKRKANILLAEKNEAITLQKEEIELKNQTITVAYKVIEEKNMDITDSIRYAKRIQEAILPLREDVNKALPQSFVMYRPKDIVSGDFYWFYQRSGRIYIAACDCTGHGVPEAFMSMIGSDMLNHTMLDGVEDPGKILTSLNKKTRIALKQHDSSSQTMDGMDIVLCMIENEKQLLTYSSANRPLYFIRNGELAELAPDKSGIAGYTQDDFSFTSHRVPLQPGDAFYLFSDGFADQFGGKKGKKFTTKRFRELLLSIHELPPGEQEQRIRSTIEQWQGDIEQ